MTSSSKFPITSIEDYNDEDFRKVIEWSETKEGIEILNKLVKLSIRLENSKEKLDEIGIELKNYIEQQEPKNEELYSYIGKFIIEFSKTELVLKMIFTIYSKSEFERAKLICSGLDFRMLTSITSNLVINYYTNDNNTKEKIKSIFKKIYILNDERNRIVHGNWSISNGDFVSIHSSRGSLNEKSYFIKAEEIKELSEKLKKVRESLIDIVSFRYDLFD